MIFHVEFGLPGLLIICGVILLIPGLLALNGWQLRNVRQLRQRLRHAQREAPPHPATRSEAAYQHFIQYVSHQSTNALQAILGALANLEHVSTKPADELEPVPAALSLPLEPAGRAHADNEQPAAEQAASLAQIEAETRRLLKMTADLRLLAQLDANAAPVALQPVAPRSVVADVIMSLADRASNMGIELMYHGPDRPPRMLANRTQLTQALYNLVENSLKYAKPDSREVLISLMVQQDAVQFTVCDDGVGIPQEMLPHIFESAYRSPDPRHQRRSGSGLGLAIVRRIVERHGGTIRVQSEYGQGTSVTVSLPRLSDPGAD